MRSMPKRPAVAVMLLVGFVMLMRGTTEASTVLAMNLEQMTDRADMIFTGRVMGKRAEWNAERTRIHTLVTFEVDRYLKGGNDTRTATLRLPGGQVGRYVAFLPGAPKFTVNEDVLVFCAGQGARIPTVLGLSLGKFTITTSAGGERIVKRDISSLMLANHDTAARKPGEPITRYRLEDVTSRIAEYQR